MFPVTQDVFNQVWLLKSLTFILFLVLGTGLVFRISVSLFLNLVIVGSDLSLVGAIDFALAM